MHWIDNEIISRWDSFCMSRRHFYHNKSQVITVLWVSISNDLATTSEITWIFLRRASNLSLLLSDVCSHGGFSHPESRIIKKEVNVAAPRFFLVSFHRIFFSFFVGSFYATKVFIECSKYIVRSHFYKNEIFIIIISTKKRMSKRNRWSNSILKLSKDSICAIIAPDYIFWTYKIL